MKLTTKTTASAAILALTITAAGFAAPSAVASPAASSTSVSTQAGSKPVVRLSAADWLEIAARADRAGDRDAARGARYLAGIADRSMFGVNSGDSIQDRSVAGWVRKAIVWTLRWAKDKVPAPIRPYADKILKVLDATEAWTKMGLVQGFMSVGIPYDVAVAAADWIIFFLI